MASSAPGDATQAPFGARAVSPSPSPSPSPPGSCPSPASHLGQQESAQASRSSSSGWSLESATTKSSVSKIPGRSNLPAEAASNPHHIVKRGTVTGFRNPYPSYSNPIGIRSAMRNIFWPLVRGRIKRPDTSSPSIPVVKPEWLASRTGSDKLRATWLGHACYYVEFPSGLRVLFDPVFEKHCSPWAMMGPNRYTPAPCSLDEVPIVDAIVISHSHYDHLSHTSVTELQRRHGQAQFFVGLGLERWFRRCGINNVTELDWWEEAELKVEVEVRGSQGKTRCLTARIECLPSQHTSGRGLLDHDTTLWCSWAVRSGQRSVWFGGDTGYRAVPPGAASFSPSASPGSPQVDPDYYTPELKDLPRCPQFAQIGQLRGPFDLGLVPIGAYSPRVAFSAMHASPADAVEIFRDTRCERAMGIHWGTWALTLEDITEPPELLKQAMELRDMPATGVFDVCAIGESREF
ncbi:hypothetical protein CDD82_4260 [Ophiocordyceps australis]|uniref:Metallo-beta-lactamase domain-containing protein n=1 Tax=Ophiocordyceps australis TaxID=1399860 RepID=A0A2C5ZPD4_9HYPO|nr:hypothetical protein CDD82_4260 [Ophiocordyceps australis]